VIVVDASVLTTALADDGADGDRVRARLSEEGLAAPQIIDLEVTSVLRRLTLAGRLPERRAALALDDLVDLPIERAVHTPLLERCWQLRANVTAYDAAYVALAELLDVALLTSDHRLARAAGPHCTFELLVAG
jgi:predicted nucleic acid-binding protein